MQLEAVYKVDMIACHKPWRYSSSYMIQNEDLFNYLKHKKESMWNEVTPFEKVKWCAKKEGYIEPEIDYDNLPEDYEEPEDDDWLDKYTVEYKFPVILLGEVTFYTE